jgi:hypothetical protein
MDYRCSAHITPAERYSDKGKRREELLANVEEPSFPVKFDENENCTLWKSLMRAQGGGTDKGPSEVNHDPFREIVEIYAARRLRVSFTSLRS